MDDVPAAPNSKLGCCCLQCLRSKVLKLYVVWGACFCRILSGKAGHKPVWKTSKHKVTGMSNIVSVLIRLKTAWYILFFGKSEEVWKNIWNIWKSENLSKKSLHKSRYPKLFFLFYHKQTELCMRLCGGIHLVNTSSNSTFMYFWWQMLIFFSLQKQFTKFSSILDDTESHFYLPKAQICWCLVTNVS